MAGPLDLQFGRDLIFTYGPLGFLSVPTPIFGAASILSVVAVAGLYFALTAVLVHLARRIVPLWAATIVVLLTARLYPFLPPFEAANALVFVLCVEAVFGRRGDEAREAEANAGGAPGRFGRADVVAVVAGIAAAVLAAGKLNVGVFSGAMLLVTAVALGRPWWRGLIVFTAAGAVSFVAIWLVTGQALTNLPAFAAGTIEIIRGYSEAMVVDTHPTVRWVYAAFAILLGLLAWVAWLTLRERPRRDLIVVAVLGAILAFAEWKTAFTRNFTFYAMVTLLVAAYPFVTRLRMPEGRTIAAFSFASLFIVSLATTRIDPIDLIDVRGSARSAAQTALAILPWRLDESVQRTRDELREDLAIPDELLGHLDGQTVHVDPWQTIAAFAYPEWQWTPLPIFQAYTAYTTALDEANADRLRATDRPARILRERVDDADGTPLAVDRRFVWFEQPETTLETVCRYEELAADDRWQVLGQRATQCGQAEPLGTVTARAGEPVTVPAESRPDRFVVVRVTGFPDGIVDRLQSLLLRSDEWYVELSDRGRFRLVPGTADDGLLLAVPDDLGFSDRFAFGPSITSLVVSAGRYGDQSDAPLTFEFLSVPLHRAADGG